MIHPPVNTWDGAPQDGRNIDTSIANLLGEGSLQKVKRLEAPPEGERLFDRVPSETTEEEVPTYYGVPTLKEPVWKWYIPAYFYVGGLAGAAAVLGAAAELSGGIEVDGLVRRCRLVAAGGAVASAGLLIADLGRPERFVNMLRVFRPTSPMNMGTWFLTAFGACSAVSALPALVPLGTRVSDLGKVASLGAGLMGLPLTGYTGVLISNTAVPLWQGTRGSLPILFSASGAASAAALLEMFPTWGRGDRIAHRFGIVAKAPELQFAGLIEAEAARIPRVARPLRRGASGVLWRLGQVLSAASLGCSLVAGRRRSGLRRAAGILGTAGALAIRFGIMQAGKMSARDPRATFEQQRAGHGGRAHVRKEGALPRAAPEAERSGSGAEKGMELTERGLHA